MFETYGNDLVADVSEHLETIEPVDALTFLTSTSYMCEDPTPFQRLVIKTFYNLWNTQPPDKEEWELIQLQKNKWGIDVLLEQTDPITTLVLVLGRRGTKCVSGDTLLVTDSGKEVSVEDLFITKERPPIFTLNLDTLTLKKTQEYEVMFNGVKPCYQVTTRTGRKIIATGNHPFLTLEGWKKLQHLSLRDRIAVPSKYAITAGYKKAKDRGVSDPDISNIRGGGKFNYDAYLHSLYQSQVNWDFIKSIEYVGERKTYDLSVAGTHNFIANDIVVHNSTTISFIATYGMYTLICKGNPQAYYGIRERHRIHITHVASAGNQAEEVFSMTSDNIRKVPFFLPFIDFDKNNSTELRLFSPYDLLINKRVQQRNFQRQRGVMKENRLPGSLYVESVTTSAASSRGRAIYLLLLSELAHFQRSSVDYSRGEDQIVSENRQSDRAIVRALSPSVRDFGKDGRILMESSPLEKGGEFYFNYCIAGGREQENPETVVPEKGYQALQFATWEARPQLSRESLDSDFRKDPVGSNMEYGAHFGNPSGTFISEEIVNRAIIPATPLIRTNPGNWRWVISVDPGGKAKSKKADTYAVGWGHVEGANPDTCLYWINGFQGFDSTTKFLPEATEIVPVDPNEVVRFIVDLVKDLGGRNFVQEICYDQWDSSAPISTLQGFGYPAFETFFTSGYKSDMYGNCLQMLEANRVRVYGGGDVGGFVDRWKLEMKYLQRIISGKYTYYAHPSSGPVQNDDYADVSANLIHRMCLRTTPTKKSVVDARKHGMGPMQVRRTITPARGPALWGKR